MAKKLDVTLFSTVGGSADFPRNYGSESTVVQCLVDARVIIYAILRLGRRFVFVLLIVSQDPHHIRSIFQVSRIFAVLDNTGPNLIVIESHFRIRTCISIENEMETLPNTNHDVGHDVRVNRHKVSLDNCQHMTVDTEYECATK
jgi:hypothetical protein